MATLNKDLLKEAGIPIKFWGLDSTTYPGDVVAFKQTTKYVRQFDEAAKEGVGLKFVGETKSCRTFLMTYILKCLLVQGRSASYFSLDDLYELYTGGNEESAGSKFLAHFRADIIAFDNITIAQGKGVKNALLKAITFRADNGLPYLIATSLSHDEICDEYGDRIGGHIEHDLLEVECMMDQEALKKLTERKLKFKLGQSHD